MLFSRNSQASEKRRPAQALDQLWHLLENYDDHQVRAAVFFKNRIDPVRLKRALLVTMNLVPVLKSRYVETEKSAYWQELDSGFDDVLDCVQTKATDDEVGNFLTTAIDPYKGPQLKAELLSGASRDTLCIVINKMVCDEWGVKEILYLLSSVYSSLRNKAYELPYEPQVSRGIQQVFRQLSPRDRLKTMLSVNKRAEKKNSGFSLPFSAGGPSFVLTYSLPCSRFHVLKKYVMKHHISLNEIILAAYYRAIHMMFDKGSIHPFAISCPVDLRRLLPWGEDRVICNLCSTVVSSLPVEIGENFEETLALVKQETYKRRNMLAALGRCAETERLFRRSSGQLLRQKVAQNYPLPRFSLNNIGAIDSSRLSFEQHEVNDAFITGAVRRSPYFQLNFTTFEDSLTFSVNLAGSKEDRGTARYFLALLDRELPRELPKEE